MLKNLPEISKKIKAIALRSRDGIALTDEDYKIVNSRVFRPVDYMRCAEFDAVLSKLEIHPQMKILDVSSPQWFTLYLAEQHPETTFHYINITDDQLLPFKKIAKVLGLNNLNFYKGDVRSLNFESNMFDKVLCISVVEHVYPESDGDVQALNEIKRVLKPEGEVLLTVPYKEISNIIYKFGAVYERGEIKKNFYAREYDEFTFENLIKNSGLLKKEALYISEMKGLFSRDFYQWGPGRSKWYSRFMIKSISVLEKLIKHPFDEFLAKRYLDVSDTVKYRVVNIFTLLKKASI